MSTILPHNAAPSPPAFNPDDAAQPGSGVFGLPHSRDDARIILLPVPFDATTSYGNGTAHGPAAVLDASMQVDLFDHQFGHVYSRGIHMLEPDAAIADLSRRARSLAEPIINRGGASPDDAPALKEIDAACERVNQFTYDAVKEILALGKFPGLVGGDHSTPFGAIRACAEHSAAASRAGMGVLHIDAHMDLRVAFEGFTWSHASIMHNVVTRIPQVRSLVQIGVRDYGKGEADFSRANADRIHTFYDLDWARKMEEGEQFSKLVKHTINLLPEHVYVSFDVDALDPSLCPHTGTPVPGGLSFNRACMILECLVKARHKIVGFDMVEVAPGPNPDEPAWDANVGARILYKLCGVAAANQG